MDMDSPFYDPNETPIFPSFVEDGDEAAPTINITNNISHEKGPKFNGIDPRRWLKQFERVAASCNWTEAMKINNLRGCMTDGSRAESWYDSHWKDTPPATFKEFEDKLIEELLPQNEKEIKFSEMFLRSQNIGEPMLDYFFHKLKLISDTEESFSDKRKVYFIVSGLSP